LSALTQELETTKLTWKIEKCYVASFVSAFVRFTALPATKHIQGLDFQEEENIGNKFSNNLHQKQNLADHRRTARNELKI
jgi:hypothetical protein